MTGYLSESGYFIMDTLTGADCIEHQAIYLVLYFICEQGSASRVREPDATGSSYG